MVSPVREAVCLILMVALCQVRGAYIRPKMNQTIQSLLRHYVSTTARTSARYCEYDAAAAAAAA